MLVSTTSFSQHVVLPPSPNVTAMAKYGQMPAGMYTGVPEVSISLYNIQ
jgi:hypothetical protein